MPSGPSNDGCIHRPPRRVGPTFSIQFGMSHLLIVAPLATLLVSTSCAQAQAPVQLAQDQPFGQLELVATFSGAMPTGVAVSHSGRIFINFPRWGDDVPYTVAELVNGNTVPYPNAEINDWPGRSLTDPTTTTDESVNSSHFVSVQSVVVDPADHLWVLDTGSALQKGATPGGPKLVAIDLTTNKVIKTILFSPAIAGPTSYLNDVRFDLTKGTATVSGTVHGIAYVTDSSSRGPNAIIVVDLATGQAIRRLNNHPSTRPDPGFIGFAEGRPLYRTESGKPPQRMLSGADGIAISADGSKIFYCPLSSKNLYSVNAAALREGVTPDSRVAETVQLVTGKGPSDGLESDAAGNIYAGDYSTNSIIRITPDGTIETILHDPRLLWPDTMSLADDGYLYVTANQLHRQPSMQNGKDLRVRPYALFRMQVNAKPVRLK